jgi:hypothetical protein
MSRRTKLIIAALFLVLLAIPVGYVILTWSTPDPLRFRMVSYEDLSDGASGGYRGKLNLMVENTSSVPVHIHSAIVQKVDPHSVSASNPFSTWIVDVPDDGVLLIPPHASRPCHSLGFFGVDSISAFDHTEVFYIWMTGTRHKAWLTRRWLGDHVPVFVSRFISSRWPAYEQTPIPLQPALPGQSQPQSSDR